jgi:hypothetical protein
MVARGLECARGCHHQLLEWWRTQWSR